MFLKNQKNNFLWLEKGWNKRPGAVFQKLSLLVWDQFRAHLTKKETEIAVFENHVGSDSKWFDQCTCQQAFQD